MTFDELKKKIDAKKMESAKAKFRLDQIKEMWSNEFGFSDITSVKQAIETAKIDRDNAKETYDKLFAEAETKLAELDK